MPRKPRMSLAGVPAHVIQCGNNRYACFFRDGDYRFYFQCMAAARSPYGAEVHAYVLMGNHVHLIGALLVPSRM